MTIKLKQLASDNYAGICPQALDYIIKANKDDVHAYGEDPWTEQAAGLLRDFFEKDCEVFFVYNGTAANSLALASLCQSYHSVICASVAHVETDECGAPEFFSGGSKILLGDSDNGKLTPESIDKLVLKRTDIHYPKPKVISLTQATEVGTVYSIDELTHIRYMADKHELKIHMDGARFCNALVSTAKSAAELSWKVGVDVLCFGGTKNGLSVGEAVIFFDKNLADEFAYRCKQAGQLASKMRYLSCQWVALLESGVWKNNAAQANDCALYLQQRLQDLNIAPLFPVQANSVFIQLSQSKQTALKHKAWNFYNFIGTDGVRLMTSWNTQKDDIDMLIKDLKE